MMVSTVYACVRVLAESVASLPLHVYGRTNGGGKYRAVKHPLYEILHSAPNAEMTSFDLRELLMSSLCLTGNAYHRIYRTRGGQIGELVPIPSDTVVVDRSKSGALVYITDDKTLRQSQVWRIPGMGGDGIVGYSPITLAREAIGLALATEQHGATLFGNGAHPGGIWKPTGSCAIRAPSTDCAHSLSAATADAMPTVRLCWSAGSSGGRFLCRPTMLNSLRPESSRELKSVVFSASRLT